MQSQSETLKSGRLTPTYLSFPISTSKSEFYTPFYFHPEIEIIPIKSERGVRVTGYHTGSFDPSDLCMVGSNLLHIFRGDETTRSAVSYIVNYLSRDRSYFLGCRKYVRLMS